MKEKANTFRVWLGFTWDDINDDRELYNRFWDAVFDIHNYGADFREAAYQYGLE